MSLERIQITVPEQPPAGSVVLDGRGKAWQRDDERAYGSWFSTVPRVFAAFDGCTWASLLLNHGPVTVVHTPEPTS